MTYRFIIKPKKPHKSCDSCGFNILPVIPLGLEPRAHTLKVYCSTN